jgi:hypothetical protein
MTPRLLLILACTFLAVSACVVSPYGGRGYYSGGGYHDSYSGGGYHDNYYGRSVWRQ